MKIQADLACCLFGVSPNICYKNSIRYLELYSNKRFSLEIWCRLLNLISVVVVVDNYMEGLNYCSISRRQFFIYLDLLN